MSGEITWIKVAVATFSDEKMKLIQSMPEGDAIIVIWFRLLMQAGKSNAGGYIQMSNGKPLSLTMLATLFDRSPTIMEFALRTFEEFGMVEETDFGFYITNWEKHQNIDGMERIREQTRKRVAKHRETKQLAAPQKSDDVTLCNVTSNENVTRGNETDKEVEKEIDKEIDQRTKTTATEPSSSFEDDVDSNSPREQFKRLVQAYENDGFGPLTQTVGDQLDEFREEYGVEWTLQAMREAVISGKRSLRYVRGILQNWKRNGGPDESRDKVQPGLTSIGSRGATDKAQKDERYSAFYALFPDS